MSRTAGILPVRPHGVGIFVENIDRHVDDMLLLLSVHLSATGCAQRISLSSTGHSRSRASVCRSLALSSPASTVAKTTDEKDKFPLGNDKNDYQVDSVDGYPPVERSEA